MKTAISMPDDTFSRAEERAHALGISRSEFVTRAIKDYLDKLDNENLTEQINEALAMAGSDDSNEVASAHGRAFLAGTHDW